MATPKLNGFYEELESGPVHERPDNMHAYSVRYESIKKFNPWY